MSATFLSLPFAVLMLLQGSTCNSSRPENNSVPVKGKQSEPMPARSAPSPNPRALANGGWGGPNIALIVNETRAEINYACAHGSITERIVPDGEGKFVVKGFHVAERGGPIRHDEDQSGQAALYEGTIDGETMTLTVSLTGNKEKVGTFTLTRGKVGALRRCR